MGYDEPSSKRDPALYAGGQAEKAPKASSRWARRIVLAVLALGIGGYLAANPDIVQKIASFSGRLAGGPPATRGGPQDPPVRVALSDSRDIPVTVHTIGTVLANSTVLVKSQVDGPLLSAMFQEGQMVRKGDLLFRIDPAPFEAALRQSEATVQRDQAQYASAKADADRALMLAERGIVSAQQRDQLVANSKALAATVAADEAALDRTRLNLSYTTIRSPIDGKTGPYIVHPGNQVHANDQAGLVTITQIQPVKISFDLPQGNLPQLQDRMREGQLIAGVTVRNDLLGIAATAAEQSDTDELPVKVDFIGNTVNEKTGTIELRATFENPDLRLVPGELVDVNVQLETLKNVVTVPRNAVNVGQDGDYVYVVDSGLKAQVRPVRVLYQDQVLAALGSGIEIGERVVTDGQLRLAPGTKVAITEPAGQAPAQGTRRLSSAPGEGTATKPANPQAGTAGGVSGSTDRSGG